ncbi:MAG: S-formylglutathione hydrolase [Sarcina sp.]
MKLKLIESHLAFEGEQCKYSHYSEVLGCDMTFSIYLPLAKEDKEDNKTSLIWCLSGLTCTDDNFAQKSGFQRVAAKYKVAVIIPDTSPRGENIPDDENWDLGQGAGFYLDAEREPWNKNFKMYSYITKELSEIAKELVPNFSGKESIMGHSMGGHGALTIAMKNSNRFKAASAFAPILNPSEVPWGIKAFSTYLGDDKEAWKAWDSTELIKIGKTVPMFITQGTSDPFYVEQLEETVFLNNARANKQKVEYKKVQGYDHSYFFIATFIEEHFDFHMKYLK